MPLTNDSYTFTAADDGFHTFTVTDTLAGSFLLKATDAGANLTTSTGLTILAGTPKTITAEAGSSQSATVAGAFAVQLGALVTDRYGNPVSGVTVTFQAPTSGATGTFSGASPTTAVTGSNGIATAPAFTAGGLSGGYSVTASVAGVTTSASFSLTNTAALSVASTFNATLLQNVTSGSIKLATFNESGGSANAADYTATVAWGDNTSGSSAGSNPALTVVVSGGQVTVYGTHTFAAAGLAYPTVTLAYGAASASTAAKAIRIDVATNVTSSAGFSRTGYTLNRSNQLFYGSLTVTNTSTSKAPISGALDILLQGLTPGVSLTYASITIGTTTYTLSITTTAAGDPVIVIPKAMLSQLAAGQSLVLSLRFSDPSDAVIGYTPDLFSDPNGN